MRRDRRLGNMSSQRSKPAKRGLRVLSTSLPTSRGNLLSKVSPPSMSKDKTKEVVFLAHVCPPSQGGVGGEENESCRGTGRLAI
jgi:hypothetical protein